MKQEIERLLREFEKEQLEVKKQIEGKIKVQNSTKPTTDWTRKITDKVRISELASEFGIESCPECSLKGKNYGIDFDDSRGWFICQKSKYDGDCNFKGNIVNFMERCG